MRILSIDQSSTCTGLSIFEYFYLEEDDYKLIWHDKYKPIGSDFEDKMLDLTNYISRIIDCEDIDLVLLENVQAQSNINTHKKLCMLLGSLIKTVDIHNLNYMIIASSTWRKLLHTKKGMQRKELKQLAQNYVFDKFGIEVSEDEADSICIACYYFENIFQENE